MWMAECECVGWMSFEQIHRTVEESVTVLEPDMGRYIRTENDTEEWTFVGTEQDVTLRFRLERRNTEFEFHQISKEMMDLISKYQIKVRKIQDV